MSDQLDLGAGQPEICAADYEPNPVIVPPGLPDDPEVDLKDLGAWVIMKSFGRRAEASLEAYCEKGGCTPESFRIYQKNLVKAGWITLIREGRPGKTGEPGSPRLWWMSRIKGEAPPMSTFGEGMVFPSPGKSKPQEKPDPKQGLSKLSKVSSLKAPKGAKHPEQDAFWGTASKIWKEYLLNKNQPAADLGWPAAAGFQGRLGQKLTALGCDELVRRWSNYLASAWPPSKSLMNFMADPDKWATIDNGKGAGSYHAAGRPRDFAG